jgi:hypothetical protein
MMVLLGWLIAKSGTLGIIEFCSRYQTGSTDGILSAMIKGDYSAWLSLQYSTRRVEWGKQPPA